MLGHVWLLFFKTVLKKIIFKNSFWYFQEKKNRVWELENIFCSKKKEKKTCLVELIKKVF